METKKFDENLEAAAAILKSGGLIAFPTETVYGLGANALLPAAVQKVFEVKGRPGDNPLIIHVADKKQLDQFVDNFHPLAEKLMDTFWPGPLTLIFPLKEGALPAVATGGLSTAAFRIPQNKKTLELLEMAAIPLVGPSANLSGKPSPTSVEHVLQDLEGKIDGVIEDGSTAIGVESTVLDISDINAAPVILRPGAVTKDQLEAVLESPVLLDRHLIAEHEIPRSPGMKYKHYSPDTPVLMVHPGDFEAAADWAKENHLRAGVLAGPTVCEQMRPKTASVYMQLNDSVVAATRGLFAGLRALDNPIMNLDIIFVETFPEEGLGSAYMNRLKKAAGQKFFSKN